MVVDGDRLGIWIEEWLLGRVEGWRGRKGGGDVVVDGLPFGDGAERRRLALDGDAAEHALGQGAGAGRVDVGVGDVLVGVTPARRRCSRWGWETRWAAT